MENFDVEILIIGAGVVGLAIGKELAETGKSVAIIEKNKNYGLETSSRNSEVIHSGIHYPPDSLKAKLCVEGNKLLYEISEKYNILHNRCGKLTIATTKDEIKTLEKLYNQGKENGVEIEIIEKEKIKKIEPEVKGEMALYTPSSGIINAHQLMDFLAYKFKNSGGFLALNEKVINIEKITGGYKVVSKSGSSTNEYTTEILINCAGLYSDEISEKLGIKYTLHWAKGDYFSINQKFNIKKLIYPIPSKYSLGIHLTPKMEGGLRAGPDIEYVEKKENPYPLDEKGSSFKVDEGKRGEFFRDVSDYLPGLKEEYLFPEMFGIRPKLQGPEDDFADFVIKKEKENFINLVGIESPGLTSCLSIGKYVKMMI